MKWTSRPVKVVLALTMLIALVGVPVVSAQQPDGRITDTTGSMGGTLNVAPIQTSYTATDDLWEWRSNKNRTHFETSEMTSVVTVVETRNTTPDRFWEPGEQLTLQHAMKLDLRYVPDMDSDSSGMITRTSRVEVSGRAGGQLSWFIPDVGDEVIVAASMLDWDAKVSGSGVCLNDDCTIRYEISGPLRGNQGQGKCGELSVSAVSEVNINDEVRGFKSVSGMDSETEVMEFWSASLTLDVARDGSTCFIGETEKNVNSSRVTFYYGDESGDPVPYTLSEPDAMRVMPGDNVTIIAYRDIPVRINETVPDALWDSAGGPLVMMQDMRVELRYDPQRNTIHLGGDVRGVFPKEWTLPNGLIAEGTISGKGVCEGPYCTIQMIRNFEILEARTGNSCGSMTLGVTVDYVHGGEPLWTFRTDGQGSITLRDHPKCFLDTMESFEDI